MTHFSRPTDTRLTSVALSLGSNINRFRHLTLALDALTDAFGTLVCSPVYESESVGFNGSNFLNSVVLISTPLGLDDIGPVLKQIEDDNGRDRNGPKFGPRTLDIDVLTYGDLVGEHHGIELPRRETARNAFVLKPMADILPDTRMPGSELTYAQLWTNYPKEKQKLWAVPFEWRGRVLS